MMESKKKAAYERLFQYFKDTLVGRWQPSDVMGDFEKSMRNAFKQVYPNAVKRGTFLS